MPFLSLTHLFPFFQPTRTLELALSLEAKVICLKQDALHLFNLALVGCACGALVNLFEEVYGYPETEEQKTRAREFEQLEHQFSDVEDEVQVLKVEEDKKDQENIFSHPFQAKPSTSTTQPSESSQKLKTKASKRITPEPVDSDMKRKQTAKKSHITRLRHPDLVKLQDATCLFPSTSIKLCWTGVTKAMYQQDYMFQPNSKDQGQTKISRYSYMLYLPDSTDRKCNYQTSNAGQMGIHIRQCHVGICIQCKSCVNVKSFHTCDMATHLRDMHSERAHKFYDALPDLSGLQAEDMSAEMAQRLREADVETDSSDSD